MKGYSSKGVRKESKELFKKLQKKGVFDKCFSTGRMETLLHDTVNIDHVLNDLDPIIDQLNREEFHENEPYSQAVQIDPQAGLKDLYRKMNKMAYQIASLQRVNQQLLLYLLSEELVPFPDKNSYGLEVLGSLIRKSIDFDTDKKKKKKSKK